MVAEKGPKKKRHNIYCTHRNKIRKLEKLELDDEPRPIILDPMASSQMKNKQILKQIQNKVAINKKKTKQKMKVDRC